MRKEHHFTESHSIVVHPSPKGGYWAQIQTEAGNVIWTQDVNSDTGIESHQLAESKLEKLAEQWVNEELTDVQLSFNQKAQAVGVKRWN